MNIENWNFQYPRTSRVTQLQSNLSFYLPTEYVIDN